MVHFVEPIHFVGGTLCRDPDNSNMPELSIRHTDGRHDPMYGKSVLLIMNISWLLVDTLCQVYIIMIDSNRISF